MGFKKKIFIILAHFSQRHKMAPLYLTDKDCRILPVTLMPVPKKSSSKVTPGRAYSRVDPSHLGPWTSQCLWPANNLLISRNAHVLARPTLNVRPGKSELFYIICYLRQNGHKSGVRGYSIIRESGIRPGPSSNLVRRGCLPSYNALSITGSAGTAQFAPTKIMLWAFIKKIPKLQLTTLRLTAFRKGDCSSPVWIDVTTIESNCVCVVTKWNIWHSNGLIRVHTPWPLQIPTGAFHQMELNLCIENNWQPFTENTLACNVFIGNYTIHNYFSDSDNSIHNNLLKVKGMSEKLLRKWKSKASM